MKAEKYVRTNEMNLKDYIKNSSNIYSQGLINQN